MKTEQTNGLAVEQPPARTSQISEYPGVETTSPENVVSREEYERLLLGVIGSVDRFQTQIDDMQRQVRGHPERAEPWLDQIAWRQADVLELEALLRDHDVKRFKVDGDRYRRSYQKCVEQRPTSASGVAGEVVERFRRGYRREQRIIRRELVAVSVAVTSQTSDKGNSNGR